MKILFVFFCFLIYPFVSKGQNETFYSFQFILIEKPRKNSDNEQKHQVGFYERSTDFFNLKGNVKSMVESIHTKNETNFEVISRSFTFNEKNNLVFLKLDSNSLNRNYFQPTYERYFYDDSGENLLKVEYQNDQYRWNNTKTVYFDSFGFLKEEQFKNRSPKTYHYDKNGINVFDYTLTYLWSKNRDSLCLNYNFLSDETDYYRQNDRIYKFEKKEIYKKEFSVDDIGFSRDEIETDSNGNIVLIANYDFTIKSSYNLHFRSFYKYNERNDLIEIRQESSIQDLDNFKCDQILKIDYLEYDNHGNWTQAIVSIYRPITNSLTDAENLLKTDELFFTREYTYFD
ncbi:MAG: hypothetical protein ACK46Y_02890 [Fluviicola sp.]